MNRGDIYLVNFEPQIGSEIKKIRPAVILSREPFNRLRRTLVVVPLSTAHSSTEFPLLVATPSSGKPSVAVVDQIKAADRARFIRKVGRLSASEMQELEKALADLLQLG
jgi:mRNA interferase MazF